MEYDFAGVSPAGYVRWWIGRIFLTVIGLGVWMVPLIMIYTYPEEKEYWKKVLAINLVLAACALIGYGLFG